jgi:hypothetical protein
MPGDRLMAERHWRFVASEFTKHANAGAEATYKSTMLRTSCMFRAKALRWQTTAWDPTPKYF